MPLKKGKSRKTISKNIKELMHKFRKTGKIGTSKPKSEKAAQEQAVAIALQKSRESSKNESFDGLVNSYLSKYLFEDVMTSKLKPANPSDPDTQKVMAAKKKADTQTPPTEAEVEAYKKGNLAAQKGVKIPQ